VHSLRNLAIQKEKSRVPVGTLWIHARVHVMHVQITFDLFREE
jgi:hypothetical protein